MRRPSLYEEIQGSSPQTAARKVRHVLDSEFDELERKNILATLDNNNNSSSKQQQSQRDRSDSKFRTFSLARVIDNFFDRKQQQRPAVPVASRQSAPPAICDPRPAVVNQVKVNLSGPTILDDSMVSDKRVGDYVFLKTLGKGTFGKVKLAEHAVTRQKVAIKIMEKSNIKTQKQKISVDREVRLMKLLNHPHIVGAIDVYETKTHLFIVMEHADGGELFDYIVKNNQVKELEARRFFRQLISAVDYCHKNSIIHRDLKPENLLLDSNKNIKLIDFGFGNTFHKDRLLETYCGSPFYAAPEMIQGIRYIGPEVDVWSMGVILYAMLSGRLPFDAPTMNELYEKIARGKYAVPPQFSQDAIHLISRMLTVDPKKRITLAEIKQHPWVNCGFPCTPIENHLPQRPLTVLKPHPQTLQELSTYGFKVEDTTRIVQTEFNLHPIVSLYHLIDEARRRYDDKQMQSAMLNGQSEGSRANSLSLI
ncbi:hypothetical protein MP228_011008 [Amoeboaphelidium protococcarum]|nr:hypothetical protein MP228_011008 [Amoeboaphelidium protococcarum]